jgi:uncharacterized membrane protein YdjX (TVP38/TMEM64 family)
MKSVKKANLIPWIILLLSFGTAIGLVVFIARNQATVKNFIQNLGAAGSLVSVLLYGILAVSPVPADPLALINGAIYGPIWGGLVTWVGMTLAALVEYFVGMRIGDAAEFEQKRTDLPFGLGNLPVDSIFFLLGGRFLTGAGSKAVSYLSGIYRISLWRYLWTASVSSLFGAFMFALGGAGLLNFLQGVLPANALIPIVK